MNLNVKLGAFRLWIACSAIWIIVFGWLNFVDVRDSISRLANKQDFQEAYDLALQPNAAQKIWDAQQQAISNKALKRKRLPLLQFEGNTGKVKARELPVSVLYLDKIMEFPAGTSADKIWHAYEPRISRQKDLMVMGFAFVAVGPPLALLVFGLLVVVIVRGFLSLITELKQ